MTWRSFLASPFVADLKLLGIALPSCIILSLDYTPGGPQ